MICLPIDIINKIRGNKLTNYFSVYSFGRVLSVLSSMLLLPLFTKKLPQSEFGIIGVLWLAVPLLSRMINLGMDVAIFLKYFKLDHKERSLYLYNTLMGITLVGLVFWTISLWRISWIQSIFDQNMSRTVFSLLFISLLSTIYITMMQGFLQFSGKAFKNVVTTILPPLFVAATTFYLIIFINNSYISYIFGMAIGNGIFGIISIIYFFNKYSIKHFYPSFAIIKRLLRVGLPTIPGSASGIILASGDRYLIKILMGLEAVAVYTYGYHFAEYILLSFFQPFQKAFAPVLLEKATVNLKEASVYSKKIINSTLVFFPLLIALIVIPFKDIMALLGNQSYDQSYIIFLITLIGILIYNTSQVYSILLNHLERTELSMAIGLIGALLNVGLNVWLIPRYGIIAAAFTTIASYLVMLILSITIMNYFLHKKINRANVLSRLIPFCVYLFGIYYIDNISTSMRFWQSYIMKISLFILFSLTTFIVFPEIRENINRIYSYLRIRTV